MTELNRTFENTLRPGKLILTSMGNYEHVSIVSDRRCPLGKLKLISATARTGTVMEEPYDTVVAGRKTGYAPRQPEQPSGVTLENARSQIGKSQYHLLIWNCETFANWAGGLKVTSRQVNGALSGAAFFVGVTKIVANEPSPLAYALMAVVGGAIGLASTQVLKRSD